MNELNKYEGEPKWYVPSKITLFLEDKSDGSGIKTPRKVDQRSPANRQTSIELCNKIHQ